MRKIGYFKIYNEGENYAGGIMISDQRGIPVEFKYTDPIKPTKIQKVLYGDVLDKYLREEVIMSNLVGKVENKPEIYIIDDNSNEYLKNLVKEGVVVVKRTQISPLKEMGSYKFVKENEAIVQLQEGQKPYRVITDIEEKESFMEGFLELASEMEDICEPLERIKEALSLICRGEF